MVSTKGAAVRRVEVITGVERRRRWSDDEKARVIEDTMQPGAVISEVARRNGLTPQQLFTRRRQARRATTKLQVVDAAGVRAGYLKKASLRYRRQARKR